MKPQPNSRVYSPALRQGQRTQIEKQVEAFIERGGRIDRLSSPTDRPQPPRPRRWGSFEG